MGIKRLNNFLESRNALKYYKNIGDYIRSFKQDGYKCFNTRNDTFIIGVDFMLYAHKYKYSCDNIYSAFINQILNFLANKIIPIYIIDGVSPIEKNETQKLRLNKKNRIQNRIHKLRIKLQYSLDDNSKEIITNEIVKLDKLNIKITSYDINKLIELFEILNIPYIRAVNEADTLISKLYKTKHIDACLSEDMDLLVFGCKKLIKFKYNQIIEYDLNYILKILQINYNEFIELCILFGCDYLKTFLRDKPDIIYEKYMTCNDIKDIFKEIENKNIDNYLIDFHLTKNIFLNSDKKDIVPRLALKMKEINKTILNNYIQKNCNYEMNTNTIYLISHINELIRNNRL